MWSRLVLASALALGLVAGCTDAPTSDSAKGGSATPPATTSGGGASASSGSTTPATDDGPGNLSVQVFFSRIEEGSASCDTVEAVTREVPHTEAVATAALTELFQGPTEAEQRRGLSSLVSAQTQDLLRSLRVENGTAYLDLGRSLLDIGNAGTSCGGSALMATIEQTLEQFPTVDRVRYAVEGEPGRFYEFMQVGCPMPSTAGDRCDPGPFRR